MDTMNHKKFLNEQLNLMMEIVEDIEEYGPEIEVFAIYEYMIEIGARLITDYWYVNEPDVGSDFDGSQIILSHYEKLENLKSEDTEKMTLFELMERFREQLESFKIKRIE
ncbi:MULTISPECIES: hypothetical protein [unclassified Granulicatella]|uniref:hypothetical protein n=1 Tax=unclassified Granulicatella TaxID=2630493 RepID=UPI00066E1FEF|nr:MULTISPECIES: hypothetical protein [unclassified Granulicatella]DAQ70241.1 MAG TPA: hypothetical protein [Caudoviricetes sp.]